MQAKAGEGATVRLAFEAFAALIDDTILYDDNEWSGAFDMDDPLLPLIESIDKILLSPGSGDDKRNGIETSIGRLLA